MVSRHGLLTQTPKNEDIDFVKIFNLCINSVRYIIRMNYLSSYYNFDYLVNFDLENKNNKINPPKRIGGLFFNDNCIYGTYKSFQKATKTPPKKEKYIGHSGVL